MNKFSYLPEEHETEKASNSYLMSLVAFMGGLPLPIINLFATLIFYFGNRNQTYFIRWHCTQALLSQLFVLPLNSTAFWWTVSIIFSNGVVSSHYIAYIIAILLLNIIEFIATIHIAIATRKGKHIEWYFFGALTNLICKP